MNVIDTFALGVGIGMNTSIMLILFLDTLDNVKNALLDILRGESNNQTKEDY